MAGLRDIPSIEQLRQTAAFLELESVYGRQAVVDALRAEADQLRRQVAAGATIEDIAAHLGRAVGTRLSSRLEPSLKPVVNATGVVIHTNLGRAPLPAAAIERIAAIASGYVNLEYDVERGERGRRDSHAERLLSEITGAEAATIVNNNAAATLLSLAALAAGREVIISRGELVEIGGGFRVPDVMAQSGAILREVGTTNRTRAADYAAAISDRTGLILRVHPSNFRIEGFAERPALADLVALGRRFGVPVIEDLGSGFLGVPAVRALADEPTVQSSVRAGVDLVMFSGDKLLGGPQAGILAGTRAAVTAVRTHPLMRALRADKLTYAALEATLREYATGRAVETVPVARMISMAADEIGQRAAVVTARLAEAGIAADTIDGASTIGGGSAPESTLPTRLVAVALPAERLAAALRAGDPPLVARIQADRVVLDLRTVDPSHDSLVVELVVRAGGRLLP